MPRSSSDSCSESGFGGLTCSNNCYCWFFHLFCREVYTICESLRVSAVRARIAETHRQHYTLQRTAVETMALAHSVCKRSGPPALFTHTLVDVGPSSHNYAIGRCEVHYRKRPEPVAKAKRDFVWLPVTVLAQPEPLTWRTFGLPPRAGPYVA